MTGNKVRASFRTAKQRLDDAKRDEKLLYVTAPGVFLAEPLDMVSVKLDALGNFRDIYGAGGAVGVR